MSRISALLGDAEGLEPSLAHAKTIAVLCTLSSKRRDFSGLLAFSGLRSGASFNSIVRIIVILNILVNAFLNLFPR
jgi:hypothetical protein